MASSQLELLPCTLEDVPAITELWYAAFSDPYVRTIWPDTPKVRQWWDDANHGDMLQKPYQYYMKVVDPSSTDESGRPRMVAYAKWDTAMPQERGPRFPPWAEDMSNETCDAFLKLLEGNRMKVMSDTKHHYLDMLATHPDYQRRGAATRLIQWGCDLADKDGAMVYVDASKQGAPLYQKFGFVDESEPGSGEVCPMARP